jgi:molecular chaperone GrpE
MKKNKEHKEDPEMKEEAAASEQEFLEHDEQASNSNQEEQNIDLSSEEITLTPEEIDEIKTKNADLEKKAEEYLDGWQRSRAEFANYKKRIAREHGEFHQTARGEVIKMYLDIADDLKRALEEKPASSDGESLADGIEIIYQKLICRLEAEGIKPMEALGQEFDPNIHEALMKEENEDFESGQIVAVMQEGYWIGDKVLRPALVRVAA